MIVRRESFIPHTTFEIIDTGQHLYDLIVDDDMCIHKFSNTTFLINGHQRKGGVLIYFTSDNRVFGAPFQIELHEGTKDVYIEDKMDDFILNLIKTKEGIL